jgi:hypothetical protein
MKLLEVNSMGDTKAVHTEIHPGENLVLDSEMPDVLSDLNARVDSALESKASPG